MIPDDTLFLVSENEIRIFQDFFPATAIIIRSRPYKSDAVLDKPIVVTLCGSTKFKDVFVTAGLNETLAGKIVLTIGCNMRTDTEIFGVLSPKDFADTKEKLDELHKRKIDLSDEILILNVGGYIGDSTRSEWLYAVKHGKRVRWLEPDKAEELRTKER